MNFIETLFGLSPDGRSGALEGAAILVILAFVAAPLWRKVVTLLRRHASLKSR